MATPSKVSEEHLRQIFDVMDVNGDGNINIQELNEGLKHAGLSRRTQSLFQVLDTDHLGVVDFQHFKQAGSSFLNTMASDSESDDDDAEEEVTVLHTEGHHLKAAAKAILFMRQARRKTSKTTQQSQEQHHIATDIRLRQWDRLRALQIENDALHESSVNHTWVFLVLEHCSIFLDTVLFSAAILLCPVCVRWRCLYTI